MRGGGRDMKGSGRDRNRASPSNPGSAAPGLEAERDAIPNQQDVKYTLAGLPHSEGRAGSHVTA